MPIVADAVLFCLTKLAHQKNWIPNAHGSIVYGFEFAEKSYFEQIPSGNCAYQDERGVCGNPFWIKNNLANSIQANERLYPLRFLKEKTRKSESKSSKGGKGILKEIELTEDAIFNWILANPSFNSSLFKTATVEKSKILVVQNGKTIETFEEQGQMALKKGDRVLFLSSGF
jgi:N-methylhydantoinase B/oxoprolinase/acetone carboxylase alpha subunit